MTDTTELERRCFEAADAVPLKSFGNGLYEVDVAAMVRAVLAEAGVAELVAALNNCSSAVTKGAPSDVRRNVRNIVTAALAEIGANQ